MLGCFVGRGLVQAGSGDFRYSSVGVLGGVAGASAGVRGAVNWVVMLVLFET